MGYEDIKDKGFDKRTTDELLEITRKGGKRSGEVRRQKANFKKTLNALLTAEIDSPEWSPLLESLGLESTLEAAINAAMIKEVLSGNVKAYEAIAKYSGQTDKTDIDQEEQQIRMAAKKAQTKKIQEDENMNEEVRIIVDIPDRSKAD